MSDEILDYMKAHDKKMCDYFKEINERQNKTDKNMERTTRQLSEAATIIKTQARTQQWMEEVIMKRGDQLFNLNWKMVIILGTVVSVVIGACALMLKAGL